MWVKICANTNLPDAQAALRLGADALGFVFARSRRQVTPEQVREITAGLPPETERIGVFDAWTPADIVAAALHAGLTGVQLHSGYDAPRSTRIRELAPHLNLIEVAHWTLGDDMRSRQTAAVTLGRLRSAASPDTLPRVLVDAAVQAGSGGLGVAFDWAAARGIFANSSPLRLVLAGGLRPENVAEAIHVLHPDGVDVASGVEASPGRKDHGRLEAFIRAARESEQPSEGRH